MFSGGRQITKAERDEHTRLSDLATGQNDALTEISNNTSDAASVLQDARSDRGQAEGNFEGSKNLVEAAERAFDENLHELQKIKEDLKVTENNVARLFDQAASQQKLYSDQVMRDKALGCLEAICDNQNEGLECIRVMHAATMKLNAAMNEQRSGASVEFQPSNEMKPIPPTKDTSEETFVQARSARSDLDTQIGRYNEKAADQYNADKVKEAEKKLADDKADVKRTKKAESKAVIYYKNLRDVKTAQARAAVEETQKAMRKIEDVQYEGKG